MDGEDASGVEALARRHATSLLDAPSAQAIARCVPAPGGKEVNIIPLLPSDGGAWALTLRCHSESAEPRGWRRGCERWSAMRNPPSSSERVVRGILRRAFPLTP